MRLITTIEVAPNFKLNILFNNGVKKQIDCNQYFWMPVFKILQDVNNFKEVRNCGSFIAWQKHEVDLSADTLWHDGKMI
ncbi:MAG: DUF2442 domain-containing protein [Bacteroidetes bacterium]|nr:DUF2442 domain-containing protein [Bacteroidota bacterium]